MLQVPKLRLAPIPPSKLNADLVDVVGVTCEVDYYDVEVEEVDPYISDVSHSSADFVCVPEKCNKEMNKFYTHY